MFRKCMEGALHESDRGGSGYGFMLMVTDLGGGCCVNKMPEDRMPTS